MFIFSIYFLSLQGCFDISSKIQSPIDSARDSWQEYNLTITKFREMKVIVHGVIKDTTKVSGKGDWEMQINLNKNKLIFYSDVAIGLGEFRVDELLNTYIDEESDIFTESLTVEILFMCIKYSSHKNISVIKTQNIRVFPDSDLELKQVEQNEIFDFQNIIFRLSCYGYTGYNCQFNNVDNDIFMTDFETGDLFCKDYATCNPPYTLCDDDAICNNQGKCYSNKEKNSKMCSCFKGWTGNNCEINECEFSEDQLYYGKIPNFCKRQNCSDNNYCNNRGECLQYGSFQFCECNKTRYTGKNCEKECVEECTHGRNCTEDAEGTFCYPSMEYYQYLSESGKTSPQIYKNLLMNPSVKNASFKTTLFFVSFIIGNIFAIIIIVHKYCEFKKPSSQTFNKKVAIQSGRQPNYLHNTSPHGTSEEIFINYIFDSIHPKLFKKGTKKAEERF